MTKHAGKTIPRAARESLAYLTRTAAAITPAA